MKLVSIKIKNYKSIKEVVFNLDYNVSEQTYSLIGINEAGKSSFLEAISFFDDKEKIIEKKFFHNENGDTLGDIEVILEYEDCDEIEKTIKQSLEEKSINKSIIDRIDIKKLIIKRVFKIDAKGVLEIEDIKFADQLKNCTYDSTTQKIILKSELAEKPENEVGFDLAQCLLDNFDLLNVCYSNTHSTLFWKSSSKYLIDQPVDLNLFKATPRELSVPLANCFNIIGINDEDISLYVDNILSDSTARKNFIGRIEEEVTNHIKNIWKEHRISIHFDLSANLITFLVEDEGVKHDNKTTDQRSDGFRQFISFLLSISAESETGELQNYILLIDEPEQHLHPKAAEFLKEDLIKISSKPEDDNVVFFATHSIFMIDQEALERNYSVTKKNNKETCIEKIDGSINTYSSIIFNVFNVYTNDYHNELIGWIQDERKIFDSKNFDEYLKLNIKEIKEKYIKIPGNETYSDIALSLYIRHQIHHPENKKNDKFTKDELIVSIDELVKLKQKIITNADMIVKDIKEK
ncbi:MAG: AAA family ATPase [Parcubacteria group bacterium]